MRDGFLSLGLIEATGKGGKRPFAFTGRIGKVRFDFSDGTDLSAKEKLEMKVKIDWGSVEWQRAHEEVFKVNDGDIVVYTTTEQKLGILTANATTPYIAAFFDLGKTGPMVVVVPPGPTGGMADDFWQRPVADLGLAGPDKGRGGKYLFLGPGQEKPENADVDYVYKSGTMNVFFGIRILTPDPKKSKEILNAFTSYPLSNPAKK